MNNKQKIINIIIMIIFPPYIIYFFIKNKKIRKIYVFLSTSLLILASIVIVYPIKCEVNYQEYLANKSYEKFEISNMDLNLGAKRFINKLSRIDINDNKYDKFRLLTNSGIYELYLGSDTGKEYTINAIYQKFPNTKLIYVSDGKEQYFDEVPPEVKIYLANNEGLIGKVNSTSGYNHDGFYEIETTKGIYNVYVTDGQVSKVTDDKGQIIYETEIKLDLTPQIEAVVKVNSDAIGEVKKVIYNQIYSEKQESLLETTIGTFLVTYHDDGNVEVLKMNNI